MKKKNVGDPLVFLKAGYFFGGPFKLGSFYNIYLDLLAMIICFIASHLKHFVAYVSQ